MQPGRSLDSLLLRVILMSVGCNDISTPRFLWRALAPSALMSRPVSEHLHCPRTLPR